MGRISPIVPTEEMIVMYRQWDTVSDFQVSNILQAPGEKPRKITPRGKDITVGLQSFGLSADIIDQMISTSKEAAQLNTLAIYKTLESNIATSWEVEQFQRVIGQLPPESKPPTIEGITLGGWDNPDVDPAAQLDAVFTYINNRTGKMPSKFVLGLEAWRILRNNPIAQKKFQFNPENVVTEERVKAVLLNTNCSVEVAKMPKALADGNFANIMGTAVFILYNEESPNQFDASAIKTFMKGGNRSKNIISEYKNLARKTEIGVTFDAAPCIVTNPNAVVYMDAKTTVA